MKKHYMIAIAIGIIVAIIIVSIIYNNRTIIEEGFNPNDYTLLTKNNPGVISLCDTSGNGCFKVNVLNDKGFNSLQYAKINSNYYIDASTDNIMPVPYGNKVTYDSNGMPNGFSPSTLSEMYTKAYTANADAHSQTPVSDPNGLLSMCSPTDPSYNNGCVTYNGNQYHLKDNYTVDSCGNIVKVIDYSSISIASSKSDYDKVTKYDSVGGLNTTYHADPSSFKVDPDFGSMWVMDKNGQMVSTKMHSDISGDILYYQPGTYRFGGSNYVPNYEDSVFLSRLTRLNSTMPVYTQNSQGSGFCAYDKINPDTIEQKCNNLNGDTCASTSCCVFLGGAKCVSGNENGPTNKSSYSDPFVLNRDYYYYQGKCYGNCPTPNVVLP
jgi:hypothetical protein